MDIVTGDKYEVLSDVVVVNFEEIIDKAFSDIEVTDNQVYGKEEVVKKNLCRAIEQFSFESFLRGDVIIFDYVELGTRGQIDYAEGRNVVTGNTFAVHDIHSRNFFPVEED